MINHLSYTFQTCWICLSLLFLFPYAVGWPATIAMATTNKSFLLSRWTFSCSELLFSCLISLLLLAQCFLYLNTPTLPFSGCPRFNFITINISTLNLTSNYRIKIFYSYIFKIKEFISLVNSKYFNNILVAKGLFWGPWSPMDKVSTD